MFRRREDGTEELISETSETAPAAAPTASASQPSAPSNPMPASAPAASQPQPFRPAPPQAAMAAAPRPSAPSTPSTPSIPTPAASSASESRGATPAVRGSSKRILTVGPDIHMKGEIASCDRVVIEGVVDATMRDVHTVELTETGALKGTAEVENAEISGSFEGDLVVRGKMTIHASGRVRGNVTYGEIEIQRGGQISGNIRNIADAKGAVGGQNTKKAA